MENILKELKGKSFEEGRKIIESTFEVDNEKLYSNCKDGRADIYEYVEDDSNWIRFTTKYEEVESDSPIADLSNGYWNISINNGCITELEINN